MSDKVLWALTVRGGPVCFDVRGACVSETRAPLDEAAKKINEHWRAQDPARKNRPAPWVVAKFVKVEP